MSCPCEVGAQQPWRSRDTVWSPASFIGGGLVVALGVAGMLGIRPSVGAVILGAVGVAIVIAGVVQARRGHRRWCLLRRSVWFGLATPGALVRLVVNVP